MKKRHLLSLLTLLIAVPTTAAAQDNFNVRRGDREAIIANEAKRDRLYNGRFHFAPAVRAGDYIFVSGVVAGAWAGEVLDREGFAESVRAAFRSVEETLVAAGAGWDGVVRMRTFHVFDHELIGIEKVEQFEVIAGVKDEFVPEPFSAWTGVGTTALLPDRGIVEIEMVVYDPQDG
ncbi:MAG: Rid family hydrolase [Gemmatimonadota bacterium]